MARRPTVKDVAQAAGVSVATVDRALNGRAPVRPETLDKIAQAAHRVGYHGRGLLAQRLVPEMPVRRFGVVLIKPAHEFYRNFAAEMEAAVAARRDIRGRLLLRYAESQAPADFAKILTALGSTVDAIASVAVNHQSLDRTVQELTERGVPVFALLNDFAQGIRRHYIGLNNMKIGRQAAWTITRTQHRPGCAAVFVGGHRWHGHDLRETGFRSFVRENAPQIRVLDTLVNVETRRVTYEATLDLLERHEDLRGIYVAGGGMEGAINALRDSRAPGEVSLVVNELTGESRAGLRDGYVTMVMATPLADLCRDLVALMLETLEGGETGPPGQHFLEPRIFLPESI